MRRLMTGYAVTFNKRHKRSGHLFQNRYKSVVCEGDPYLLELIRYIHLNPLRAGLVKNLRELDKYPWTGHSVIMGRRKNPLIPEAQASESKVNPELPVNPACPVGEKHRTGVQEKKSLSEKTIEDVLLHFDDTVEPHGQEPVAPAVRRNPPKLQSSFAKASEDTRIPPRPGGHGFLRRRVKMARRRYRLFVKNGIEQGKRPEFQGGGLVRSFGGDKRGLLGRKKEEREKGDARILGSGDFVTVALKKAGEDWESQAGPRPPLEALINIVSEAFDLSSQQLKSRSRRRPIVDARSVLA